MSTVFTSFPQQPCETWPLHFTREVVGSTLVSLLFLLTYRQAFTNPAMLDFCARAGAICRIKHGGCLDVLIACCSGEPASTHPRDIVFAAEQGLRSHRAKAD